MSEAVNNILTRIFGKRLGLRLRFYKPDHVSKDNKVIYSYIYGIDDVTEDNYGYQGNHNHTNKHNVPLQDSA